MIIKNVILNRSVPVAECRRDCIKMQSTTKGIVEPAMPNNQTMQNSTRRSRVRRLAAHSILYYHVRRIQTPARMHFLCSFFKFMG